MQFHISLPVFAKFWALFAGSLVSVLSSPPLSLYKSWHYWVRYSWAAGWGWPVHRDMLSLIPGFYRWLSGTPIPQVVTIRKFQWTLPNVLCWEHWCRLGKRISDLIMRYVLNGPKAGDLHSKSLGLAFPRQRTLGVRILGVPVQLQPSQIHISSFLLSRLKPLHLSWWSSQEQRKAVKREKSLKKKKVQF